uniref:Uncharacterized protein n=1 Tax=Steinernema glaseri TaxID=37863 RepID=A0A1I7Z1Y2_9BILA
MCIVRYTKPWGNNPRVLYRVHKALKANKGRGDPTSTPRVSQIGNPPNGYISGDRKRWTVERDWVLGEEKKRLETRRLVTNVDVADMCS